MKYIFVGDIHGKVEQVERALAKDGQKIFVGDFMDSFDRSWQDHAKCLELVIEAITKNEAKAIYGNHELSYLNYHHRCSGYDPKNLETMMRFRDQITATFKPFLLLASQLLVTHAGLTNQLWKQNKLDFNTLDARLTSWWDHNNSPMHYIGSYRGGLNSVGGLFWCDFNHEFEPVKDLTQIFGHTAVRGIQRIENSFCIDCLDHEHSFLEMNL